MEPATTNVVRAAPWNKGKRPVRNPAEAEGDLGHSDSTATGPSSAGTGAVQPRHRQQVSRCDLVALGVHDLVPGSHVAARAIVMQSAVPRTRCWLCKRTIAPLAGMVALADGNGDALPVPSEPPWWNCDR